MSMGRPLPLPEEQMQRLRAKYHQEDVEDAAKKRKKHRYLPPLGVGRGPAMCTVCGQPQSDPDHDGDVDPPGQPDVEAQQADVPVDDDGTPTGCMVAFYPTPALARQIAVDGGEAVDQLHVTLAFLGLAPEGDTLDRLRTAVEGFAAVNGPVDGELSGVGLFTAGPTPVTYASLDCPSLPVFRQSLVDALTDAGFPPDQTHGYTPHMTLAYGDHRDTSVPNATVNFDVLWLVAGTERFPFALPAAPSQPEEAALKQTRPAGYAAETEVIRRNKQHPNASKKHPFRAAEYPQANGDLRCLMCGGAQPDGGMCNADGDIMANKPGATLVPIAAADDTDAGKIAAGIDAGVDQALTLLRSCNNDTLPPYAQQARDLLQGIEPACDALLDYFGVSDPDESETAAEAVKMPNGSYPISSQKSANSAWDLRGRSGAYSEAQVVAHIRAACTKLGLRFPGDTQQASAYNPDHGKYSIVQLGDDWTVVDGGGTILGRYETLDVANVWLQAAIQRRPLPTDPEFVEGEEPSDVLGGDPVDEAPKVDRSLAFDRIFTSPVPMPRPPVQTRPGWLSDTKAFVEEINGKTILTTQASAELADSMTHHEFYLWTQGRLVAADEPNRNGAFWSSGDLELGQTTVPYGPLNWLHEEKHVIGTIAAASYAEPNQRADVSTNLNHIAIAAPIWRWLYPDEASVIEMASETGKLWYSMECISKQVACVGDGGCGAEVSYFDYTSGQNGACEHMIQRSGTRRFVDPIFLGAAVIVPPVRPGWGGADAVVARQAASIAEHAFAAAGNPDMTASEWEQLMTSVVQFATT